MIGRFVSPDTVVPRPFDPQSLNRYSYCRNNPLIYVDPTGYYDVGADGRRDPIDEGFAQGGFDGDDFATDYDSIQSDWETINEEIPSINLDPDSGAFGCPLSPPVNNPQFEDYSKKGNPTHFHCGSSGYTAFIEERHPDPKNPQLECVYDNTNQLVDKSHESSRCRGTHNQYSDTYDHIFNDSGGVAAHGWGAYSESRRHDVRNELDDLRVDSD